ncbi:glycosyl transferase [Salipaludibacillus neizhouensis]|uniref:Glycosyl transferase n=1 Tax=Salipaludibacillus neizhouensis TaxID=885475 RepID=A0A3A9K9Q7_9BACI|nr:glycosyltransferase family 2 protein [Salipaludibacillus neizhouensis]RKL68298.1 glycosyl transferase [Salipaludibacillus neizhouensis]
MESINIQSEPLISVITPSYNASKYLEATIKSVLAQKYSNWEMIIVDDCSSDNSVDIIKKYANEDERIRYVVLSTNSGAAVARNTAINESKGNYIAFLDSDDQWFPEKLHEQLMFMQKNNLAFSYTSYINIDEKGEKEGSIVEVPSEVNYKQLLKQNVIGCLTVMLNKDMIGQVEMVNIRTRQDYVLWLDLCKRGFRAVGIQKPLSKYRIVENSVSSNKLNMAKQNWKVYRDIEKLGLVKSVYYFIQYALLKIIKYTKSR